MNITIVNGGKVTKEVRELVRQGGGMKHGLMTRRLESREAGPPGPLVGRGLVARRRQVKLQQEYDAAVSAETQHCPACNMHVTAEEAAWCMICTPFPEMEESGDGRTHTTTATPAWWTDRHERQS